VVASKGMASTELHDDRGAERHAPRLFFDSDAGPRELHFEAPEAVIGSASSAPLRLDVPTVSRVHAALVLRDDGLWVRDLGSTNGTFVQGVRVHEARLDDGAVLRLGAAIVRIRYGKAEAEQLFPEPRFHAMVGGSVAMRRLYARIAKAAKSRATVLVQGETGTGKELVARALHAESERSHGPFVTVDCGALSESLIESELFGHVRGAFTGAVGSRPGAIELAEGGTVFLDEIAELPLAVQPKLLRALESRTVRRVGASDHQPVDVRFVAATHRDLARLAAEGAFREDLYFRIAVLGIPVPPLRERLDDLPTLAEALGSPLDPKTLDEARKRSWPGNVRELRNFLERRAVLGEDPDLARAPSPTVEGTLPGSVALDVPFKELSARWMSHLERHYLAGLMEKLGGNVTAVARAAGLDRSYVHRLLRKHGLGEG